MGEQNVNVLNSPAHVYCVSNPGALTMSQLTIDNCKPLAHIIPQKALTALASAR